MLNHASARRIALADNSIHFSITSPPYWSLRLYSGLEPEIWGGDGGCQHVWGKQQIKNQSNNYSEGFNERWGNPPGERKQENAKPQSIETGQFCQHCGAWRGLLGNEPDPFLFIDHLVEVFREVKRVLHPKGTLVINIGDTYMGSGGAYAHDHANPGISKSASRDGYKPDGGRGATKSHPLLKPKDKALIPQRLAIALQEDGWYVREVWEWIKTNGLPSSVTDRPTTSHEYLILCSKSERYYWDYVASMLPTSPESVAREQQGRSADHKMVDVPGQPFHSFLAEREPDPNRKPPPTRRYRTSDIFFDSLEEMIAAYEVYLNHLKACRGDGLLIDEAGEILGSISSTNQFEGSHFATFPPSLIRPLIASGCPQKVCSECGEPWVRTTERIDDSPSTRQGRIDAGIIRHHENGIVLKKMGGNPQRPPNTAGRGITETTGWLPQCTCQTEPIPGIVLDPFVGSGTTVKVANQLGLRAIGLDMSAKYIAEYSAPLAENITTEASLKQARPKKKKKAKVAKQQLSLF